MDKHLKDFEVSEVIDRITGYRGLTGDNLDYFTKGTSVEDVETIDTDTSYYVSYKGNQILTRVLEEEVTAFFDSGEYKKYIKYTVNDLIDDLMKYSNEDRNTSIRVYDYDTGEYRQIEGVSAEREDMEIGFMNPIAINIYYPSQIND